MEVETELKLLEDIVEQACAALKRNLGIDVKVESFTVDKDRKHPAFMPSFKIYYKNVDVDIGMFCVHFNIDKLIDVGASFTTREYGGGDLQNKIASFSGFSKNVVLMAHGIFSYIKSKKILEKIDKVIAKYSKK